MTSASLWVQGARPRTLGAAVAPVLVGTSAAVAEADGVIWWRAACALVVALALQVGRELRQRLLRRRARHRQGPQGSGAAHRHAGSRRRAAVKRAAVASRSASPRSPGLVLSLVVNPWLLLVGVAAIARRVALHRRPEALRLPRPRRDHGARVLRLRGDGRLRVRAGEGRARARRGGDRSSSGCSRARSSLANNVRDIPTDAVTGKRTLAVRVGAIHRPAAVRRVLRRVVPRRWSPSASRNRGRCSACSRCRWRSHPCARSSPAPIPRRWSRCWWRRPGSRSSSRCW